jgi:hypothetical protein
MNIPMPFALLIVGAVMLGYGCCANGTLASHLATFFTGQAADSTVWMVAGGTVCVVGGMVAALGERVRALR